MNNHKHTQPEQSITISFVEEATVMQQKEAIDRLVSLHEKVTYFDGVGHITECRYCVDKDVQQDNGAGETCSPVGVWPCDTMEPLYDVHIDVLHNKQMIEEN